MEKFSIGKVARLTGLTEFTLRAWERRYGSLKPKRGATGRREYDRSDVEKLKLLRLLTEQGHSIKDIARLPASELGKLLTSIRDEERFSGVSVNELLRSLDELDIFRLNSLLKSAQLQLDTRTFLLETVAPFMSAIGRQVADENLDVCHEHAASAVVRNILSGILYSTERSLRFDDKPPVVFATPEGDYHEFGILISAILALLNGYRVFYLGPNVPFDSLERAAVMTQSELIIVGVSAPAVSLSSANLKKYFSDLSQTLPLPVELWIGGGRVDEVKDLKSLTRRKHKLIESLHDLDRAMRRAQAQITE